MHLPRVASAKAAPGVVYQYESIERDWRGTRETLAHAKAELVKFLRIGLGGDTHKGFCWDHPSANLWRCRFYKRGPILGCVVKTRT